MASASEILFAEMGLDPFGYEPGYVPPKPPSKSEIAKRGERLDKLERDASSDVFFRHWDPIFLADPGYKTADEALQASYDKWEFVMHQRHEADLAYGAAISARNEYARWKAKNAKSRTKRRDRKPLEDAKFYAEQRLDLIAAAGPDFCTRREFIDAHAAHCLASDLFDIAETKFDMQEREARSDRRKGIVRRPRGSNIYRY